MGAVGTAVVDFGAWPGSDEASVTVTGQAGILATSFVDAWIQVKASADHSADEHRIEDIDITAGNIAAATGFTIYALPRANGDVTRLYGQFNVQWVWT